MFRASNHIQTLGMVCYTPLVLVFGVFFLYLPLLLFSELFHNVKTDENFNKKQHSCLTGVHKAKCGTTEVSQADFQGA